LAKLFKLKLLEGEVDGDWFAITGAKKTQRIIPVNIKVVIRSKSQTRVY
jgi:hypothetical protein